MFCRVSETMLVPGSSQKAKYSAPCAVRPAGAVMVKLQFSATHKIFVSRPPVLSIRKTGFPVSIIETEPARQTGAIRRDKSPRIRTPPNVHRDVSAYGGL